MSFFKPPYAREPGGLGNGGVNNLTPDQLALLISMLQYANKEPLTQNNAELIMKNNGELIYGGRP